MAMHFLFCGPQGCLSEGLVEVWCRWLGRYSVAEATPHGNAEASTSFSVGPKGVFHRTGGGVVVRSLLCS